MKKLLALFMICLLFSPAIAHTEHNDTEPQNQSSSADQEEVQSGFTQLYPEYRSGTVWVIAEILIVLGATALAARHYFGKSEHGSLKEFIKERVL